MNLENLLGNLVTSHLADDHHPNVLGFTEQLLIAARQVGELSCAFTSAGKWRFTSPGQDSLEVELGRGKTKIRMLCARLSVLCNESGDQDVSIYGGEGVIRMVGRSIAQAANNLEKFTMNGPATVLEAQGGNELKWSVRFKNTPHEQELTIISK